MCYINKLEMVTVKMVILLTGTLLRCADVLADKSNYFHYRPIDQGQLYPVNEKEAKEKKHI